MIEFEGKKFLNEQEAYLYCLEQIKIIKQSLGNALPDPIQGPQGEDGEQGPRGPEGPRGTGVFGCTAVLPSATAYQEGDFYILFDGSLFKKINGSWVRQTILRGPQGPVGLTGGTQVIANPVDAATDELNKVKIDGTTYNIKDFSSGQVTALKNILIGEFYYDEENSKYVFGDDPVEFNYPVTFNGNIILNTGLEQITDTDNNPIVICENFKDKNGNTRFVNGNLSTSAISGVTFTYAKWSLSGSHIMFVLCGEVAANTTLNVDVWASVTLPDYIKNKISGVFASTNIEVKDSRAYYDDWNSINIQTVLQKTSDGVQILMIQNPTSTAIAHFRIQYDLLIDMD